MKNIALIIAVLIAEIILFYFHGMYMDFLVYQLIFLLCIALVSDYFLSKILKKKAAFFLTILLVTILSFLAKRKNIEVSFFIVVIILVGKTFFGQQLKQYLPFQSNKKN